jgi:hypothetical protein
VSDPMLLLFFGLGMFFGALTMRLGITRTTTTRDAALAAIIRAAGGRVVVTRKTATAVGTVVTSSQDPYGNITFVVEAPHG